MKQAANLIFFSLFQGTTRVSHLPHSNQTCNSSRVETETVQYPTSVCRAKTCPCVTERFHPSFHGPEPRMIHGLGLRQDEAGPAGSASPNWLMGPPREPLFLAPPPQEGGRQGPGSRVYCSIECRGDLQTSAGGDALTPPKSVALECFRSRPVVCERQQQREEENASEKRAVQLTALGPRGDHERMARTVFSWVRIADYGCTRHPTSLGRHVFSSAASVRRPNVRRGAVLAANKFPGWSGLSVGACWVDMPTTRLPHIDPAIVRANIALCNGW